MSPTIREWPAAERPRERLARLRPEAISSTELLAIVLGSGAAGRSALELAGDLITTFEGSLRSLAAAEPDELCGVAGIGPARASAVAAALALGRRLAAEPARAFQRVRGPSDVYARLGPLLRDRRQEEFWVLYLDVQCRVRLERCLTVGLLNSSLVHPREVFSPAIACSAASIILSHNHPSGDPEPSPEDVRVTSQLVQCGRLLGIPVRDHVVLGDSSYVSLMERGLCGTDEPPGALDAYVPGDADAVAERESGRPLAARAARASSYGAGMVRLPVWLTPLQYQRLRVLARSRGRSSAEIVRRWVDDGLARESAHGASQRSREASPLTASRRTPASRTATGRSEPAEPSADPRHRSPLGGRSIRRTAR